LLAQILSNWTYWGKLEVENILLETEVAFSNTLARRLMLVLDCISEQDSVKSSAATRWLMVPNRTADKDFLLDPEKKNLKKKIYIFAYLKIYFHFL
jgi:hypothetical protein